MKLSGTARTMFEMAGNPAVIVGRDDRIVLVNAAFEALSGWKRRSLEGKRSLSDFIVPVNPPRTPSVAAPKGKRARLPAPLALSFRARSGAVTTVIADSAPLSRTAARLVSFRLQPADRPSGQLSQHGWEELRRFFDQNDEALIVFHPDTVAVIDVNHAACRLFCSSHAELLDRGLALFADPHELANLKGIISATTPSDQSYVMTYFRRDGTKSILRFRTNVIGLREGRLIYCSFRDIGEEIRLKEEMRFHQAQLIHANKMGALGMLVSSVAHEISNPNNCIMHNIRIIADAWKDVFPILREHYRENGDYYLGGIPLSEFEDVIPRLVFGINDGSERIANIVQNLRELVRSDRARLDGTVDIPAVVLKAVTLMHSEISRHTGNFSLQCDEQLPPVKGSTQKLEQVVINLLMNALQSLTDRSQRVAVVVVADVRTGQVVLTISDEGSGMSETVRNRIMEPFFSTKLEKGGTGLGLYISHSIIREHKGTIAFASGQGAGTTVTVRLPAVRRKENHGHDREPFITGIAR